MVETTNAKSNKQTKKTVLVATNLDNAGQIMNHLAKIQTEYTWEVTDDNDTAAEMCEKLQHKPYIKKIKKV